jgi:outer membrane protein OmpA-like peptidoglycan-associated protein
MKSILRSSVMLVTALGLGLLSAAGQTSGAGSKVKPPETDKFDLGLTFNYKLAKISNISGSTFGLAGGGADGVYWLGGKASNLGLAFDISGETASNIKPGVNLSQFTFVAGPRYQLWKEKSKPHGANLYGEVLGGYAHAFNSVFPALPAAVSSANSFSLQAGGGFNLPIAKKLDLRLIEADYVLTKLPNNANDFQSDLRLSAGLVFRLGVSAPVPVTLACAASPASIFPGDPVTLTATAGALDSKLNAVYSWSGAGAAGTAATANVSTAALAPGSYTVKCGVKQGKPGKEGLKPWQVAEASTSFTVKAFEPPTVSCSASPTTIKPGETATVTASAISPQNRPLSYSYSATAGSVGGSGASATFNSAGAPTGVAGITCTATDDKNQTATANTGVTVLAPYVAPIPHTQALCSVAFGKDKKRPSRVDNEAKACLDEVALDLQRQPDSKAVVVGSSDGKEKEATAKAAKRALKNKHVKVVNLAAERAANVKEYLVTDKGIDASRVSVATSTADGQKSENYLVPSGATFFNDVAGTSAVDETVVKPEVRRPLGEKHHSKKRVTNKGQ